MKLIVCLDERQGMMFNHRRQSRDRVLINDLLCYIDQSNLHITPYSAPLFADKNANCHISISSLDKCGEEDYFFAEDVDPSGCAWDEIVIYRWNRHYPADRYFTVDMSQYRLIMRQEFAGSSHDKIIREVWKK